VRVAVGTGEAVFETTGVGAGLLRGWSAWQATSKNAMIRMGMRFIDLNYSYLYDNTMNISCFNGFNSTNPLPLVK
jgi:hypothetical protein